ncbi:MAG TPA: hypothetical protein VGM05_08405 [Planctomycetaceae bacterium]
MKRDKYWKSEEDLFYPIASKKTSKRKRRNRHSAFWPIVWATGNNASRKYGDADDVGSALANFSATKAVVIWTRRHWSDRLALWWSLSSLARMNVDVSRFTIATAESSSDSTNPRAPDADSISCLPVIRLRSAFDKRVALTNRHVEIGSGLWAKYAAPSPLKFDEAFQAGIAEFPDLTAVAEPFGWLFPRSIGSGMPVRLSRLDEIFLEGLKVDVWLTPQELLRISLCAKEVLDKRAGGIEVDLNLENMTDLSWLEWAKLHLASDPRILRKVVEERISAGKSDLLMPIIMQFGDMLFRRRLHEWAMHQPASPVLEFRPGSVDKNDFTRVSYRLTQRGKQLIDEGLLTPDDAPAMFAGGCEVYRKEAFWVRCKDDSGCRLERR